MRNFTSQYELFAGMKLLIAILSLLHNIQWNTTQNPCVLHLRPEKPDYQPMYYLEKDHEYKIARPVLSVDGEVDLVIEEFERLIVSCLVKNPITRTSQVEEYHTASCKEEKLEITTSWLTFSQKEKNLGEEICSEKLAFKKKPTGKKCAGELSQLYDIGIDVLFRHNSRKVAGVPVNFVNQKWLDEVIWYPLYSICFDESVKELIYTKHTIAGLSIRARQTGISESPKMVFGSEFRIRRGEKINPEEAFELSEMEKGMIEDASFLPYFNYEKKNLMPKTLVPPEDMLYFNWKPASYFYLNVTPMWSNLDCTWKNLEKHIRIAASRYETDLIVYSGVFGKYTINGLEITLDKYRRAVTVPYYFWKIVYHRVNRSGIAFIMNNDPFKPNPRLCIPDDKNVGRSWPVYSDAYRLGLLYPCLVDDLRLVLENAYHLPKFTITQELYYPTY